MSDEMIKFKSSGVGGSVCGHESVVECNDFMQDMEQFPEQPKTKSELDTYVQDNAFSSGGICCNKESGIFYYFSGMKFGDYSTVKDIQFKPATPTKKSEVEVAKPDMEFKEEDIEAGKVEGAKPAAEKPAAEKKGLIEIDSEDALYDTLKALDEGEYAIVNFSKSDHKGSKKYERAFRRLAKKHEEKASFVFVEDSDSKAWSSFRKKLSIEKRHPAVFAMDREGNCYEVEKKYRPLATVKALKQGKQTMGIIAKIEIPADEPAPAETAEVPIEPIELEEPSMFDKAIGAAKKIPPFETIMAIGAVAAVAALFFFRKRVGNFFRSIGSGMAGAKDGAVAKMKSVVGGIRDSAERKAADKNAAAEAEVAKPAEAMAETAQLPAWAQELAAKDAEAAQAIEEKKAEAEKEAAEKKKADDAAAAEAKKKAAEKKKKEKADNKAIAKLEKEHKALMASYAKKKKAFGKITDPTVMERKISLEQMFIELNIHEQLKNEPWYVKLNSDQRITVLKMIAEGHENIGVEGISKITYWKPRLQESPEDLLKCRMIFKDSKAVITYEEGGAELVVELEKGLTPKQQKLFTKEYDALIGAIESLPDDVRERFHDKDMSADALARRLVMQRHLTTDEGWKLITDRFAGGKAKGIHKTYPVKLIKGTLDGAALMADPAANLDAMHEAIPNLSKFLPKTADVEKLKADLKAEAEAKAKKDAEEAKLKAEAEEAAAKQKAEAEKKAAIAQYKKEKAKKKAAAEAKKQKIEKIKDPILKARAKTIEALKVEIQIHEYLKNQTWYQELEPNKRIDTIAMIADLAEHKTDTTLNLEGLNIEVAFKTEVFEGEPLIEVLADGGKDGKGVHMQDHVNAEHVIHVRNLDADGEDALVRIPIDREMPEKEAAQFAKEYKALVRHMEKLPNDVQFKFVQKEILHDTLVRRLIMHRKVMSEKVWDMVKANFVAKGEKGIFESYPKKLIEQRLNIVEQLADPVANSDITLVELPKIFAEKSDVPLPDAKADKEPSTPPPPSRKEVIFIGPEEAAEIKAGAEAKKSPPPPPPPAAGKKPSSTPPPPPKKATPPPPPPKKAPPPGGAMSDPLSVSLSDLGGVHGESGFDYDLDGPDADAIFEEREVVSEAKPVPPPLESSEAAALAEWEKFEKTPYFESMDSVVRSDLAQFKLEIGKAILHHKFDPTFAKDTRMIVGEMITLDGYDLIIQRDQGYSIKSLTKAASAKPPTKSSSKKVDTTSKSKGAAEKAKDAAKKK